MLWIALHLPHFALDTLAPRWRTEAAFVHAGQGANTRSSGQLVVACSMLAAQAGVRPGMPVSSARSLAPQACVQALDTRKLADRFNDIAALLLPYTPCIVQADAYTLLLEVSASLRLFRGLRALRRQLVHTLRPQAVSLRLATAPSAGGAWLLAVHPGGHLRHALSQATLARRLDALHCRHLPAAQPYLDWLDGIGCRQLGMLRRLPRAELQRRSSIELLQALDCAYGQAHDTRLVWFTPPSQFHQRLELPAPGTGSGMLLLAAQRLLRPFCSWLDQHKLAATRISLLFEHDARRHATPFTPLTLQSALPVWQAEGWLRLVQAHLANLILPAPVLALRLQSQMLQARPAASAALLPAPGGEGTAGYHETLELLAARLGRDAIAQAAPRDDHRPETANAWAPPQTRHAHMAASLAGVSKPITHASSAVSANGFNTPPMPRPSWLLDAPLPLSSQGSQPWHKGPLTLLHGPERIEDGWWAAPMRRDYYVAQSAQGVRYWIFRSPQGWFLHGLFG